MKKAYFELTNPQKSIWLTDQMYKNTPIANVCGCVIIEEKVNFVALQKAMNLFVMQNDSFRLKFVEIDDVKQYVSEYVPFNVEIEKVETDEDVKKLEKEVVSRVFNVCSELLFKFQMFEFPDGHGGFIVNAHHLIADAWTAGMVVDEIVENYANILNKKEQVEQKNSYIDYIISEREYLQSERFEKDAMFWNEQFEEIPEIAQIPSNNIDYLKSACLAAREEIVIEKELIEKINEFCRANKISIFNFFMAVYAIYIGRVTNLYEFVLGTPILNRATFKEKHTSGMFISTVPFKVNLGEDYTFAYFASKVASDTLGILRHQRYPYNTVLENLRKKQGAVPNLYDILISYQNVRTNKQTSTIPYHTRWVFNSATSDGLDISLCDMNDNGSIDISYDYSLAKYNSQDIIKMHERILHIIAQVLENPQKKLIEFEVITSKEKQEMLENKEVPYKECTIIDLFTAQVEKTPNQTALVYKDEKVTYKALANMANVIANELKDVRKQKIAVIANKSPKLISALLGIMKSGNSYVPIDPSYPKERIDYILEDCRANYVIASKQYYSGNNAIYLEDIDFLQRYLVDTVATKDDLAYLIYTSGTTGKPKGVQIQHKNIVNTLQWRKEYYNFNEEIVTLQVPSYSFDSSVEDIFTSLISGSTLVIPPSNKLDINIVEDEIKKHKVNHFLVVPSLYKVILSQKTEVLKDFKFVTIAGEGFGINLVQEHFRKLPNVRLINEYGPTENSVCSTYYELSEKDDKVLIGQPISNCKTYVLDSNLNFLPEGASGELYVAGKGVSIGYLNKPETTSKNFIKSPFSDEILYKTGDIVKLIDDNLEFVGRNDGQVKLNGFRIELKEIDNCILKHPNVKDGITVLQKLQNGRDILCSYIIADEKIEIDEHLKENLPYYMIPEVIVVDEFPLTPNGKVDKSKLPVPEVKLKQEKPKTQLEQEILNVCCDVLNNKELGVTDDFFKMGMADSLSILTISSKLFAKNIKIETQDFYKYTTVRALVNRNIVKKNHENIIKPKYETLPEEFVENTQDFIYKNVLLTGVTGYLGIHLLYELLTKTNSNLYCIVRNKYNKNAYQRLEETIIYYFGKEFLINYASRIIAIEGELSQQFWGLSKEKYIQLQETVDCIIHSAAITKHYGKEDIFVNENIVATKNLIQFAKQRDIILNYISTTTISGNYLVKTKISTKFTENDFFVGQDYENNPYVKSKFEAEKMIFEEQYAGLRANIFRLGNLMGRAKDGAFQKNKLDNAFYMRLLTFAGIGMLPKSMKESTLEFSPVDDVANSILELISFENAENKTFHIFNPNEISMQEMLRILARFGIEFRIVEEKKFIEELKKNPKVLKYLVSDIDFMEDMDYNSSIKVVNGITESILTKTKFKWTTVNEEYIIKFINATKFIEDVKTWREKL